MKRIFAAIGVSLSLVSAVGCTAPVNSSIPNRMANAFTAEVTMTADETESKASLTRYGTGAWSVVFSEPQAIAGVQLDFMDNDITASYKGLEFSVPKSAQSVKTCLQKLMEAADSMAADTAMNGGTAKDQQVEFAGELPEGGYTLTVSQDGTPMEFTLPSYNLHIVFDSFTDQGSPSESGASTESGAAMETAAETAAAVSGETAPAAESTEPAA